MMTIYELIQTGKYDTHVGLHQNQRIGELFQRDLEQEAGLPLDFPRRSADGLYQMAYESAQRQIERDIAYEDALSGASWATGHQRGYDMQSRRALLEVMIKYGELFRNIVEPLLGQTIGQSSNDNSPMANAPYDRIREIDQQFDNILRENNIAKIVIQKNRHSGQE